MEPLFSAIIVMAATTPAASGLISQIVTYIVALGGVGGLATLLTTFFMRRKIKSEAGQIDANAMQILSNTSVSLLGPMKEQITFLTQQLKEANEKISTMTITINAMADKIDNYESILKSGMVEGPSKEKLFPKDK